MDRSEGAKPKGHNVALFQARGVGKPCVAQPPQRDKKKRGGHAHRGDRLRSGWAEPREGHRPDRICPESKKLSARPWAQPAA